MKGLNAYQLLGYIGLLLVGLAFGKRVLVREVSIEEFNQASIGSYTISGKISDIATYRTDDGETKYCLELEEKLVESDLVCAVGSEKFGDKIYFGTRVKLKVNRANLLIQEIEFLDPEDLRQREAVATGKIRTWNGYSEIEIKIIGPNGERVEAQWASLGERFTPRKDQEIFVDKYGRAWKNKRWSKR